ncbi:MAG: response regulator [Phycisphaerales bacterium]
MPGLTVLLVDDEPHITHIVSRKLEGAGINTIIARDGEEGLRVAIDVVPDMVVTDLQMPRMTGFELASELRQNPATADIPVILLTARGYFLSQKELEQTNIREVMSKPFTARGLLDRVIDMTRDSDQDRRNAA